jgi:hypothetical protein
MTLKEQIQEGQHRANQVTEQIRNNIDDLKGNKVALFTFQEELEAALEEIFDAKPLTNPQP